MKISKREKNLWEATPDQKRATPFRKKETNFIENLLK